MAYWNGVAKRSLGCKLMSQYGWKNILKLTVNGEVLGIILCLTCASLKSGKGPKRAVLWARPLCKFNDLATVESDSTNS